MIGTMRWNLTIGLAGTIFTFLFSASNNPLETTLLRSFYTFLILFVIGFAIRFLLGAVGVNSLQSRHVDEEQYIGSRFDMTTPEEPDSLQHAIKENIHTNNEKEQFAPLQPPRLVTKKEMPAEEMAQAIRQLSEQ